MIDTTLNWRLEARVGSENHTGHILRFIRDWWDEAGIRQYENRAAEEVLQEAFSEIDRLTGEFARLQREQPCTWTEDGDRTWATECGQSWTSINAGPVEDSVRFCPSCGRRVVARACGEGR